MKTSEILSRFRSMRTLVVGDICLDRWCNYNPDLSEPSRETGIPRVAVFSTEITAGAGGTVANNLGALGAGRVAVLGAIGKDGFGFELKQALLRRRIESNLLVETDLMPTFTYSKLLNGKTGAEDLARVDFVFTQPIPTEVESQIVQRLNTQAAGYDVIIVADQAETNAGGVVTPRVRDAISELARRHSTKTFWVDSRMRPELFRDVIVKPNEREATEACQRAFGQVDFNALRVLIGGKPLIVTRGGEGAEIWDENGRSTVNALNIAQPVDICGAGDSFSAGGALAYSVTNSAKEAARVGNLVAAVTIMKRGTGTASAEEVLALEAAREKK
jgi:rfaE bifunctional protein kinase chain/domain